MSSTQVLITSEQIQSRISELAAVIAHDYQGKQLVLVGVMKGSVVLLSDLIRALWEKGLTECEIDFVTVRSYEAGTVSSKNPILTKDMEVDIAGKHVLIVEDIIDTGYTIHFLLSYLMAKNPASIKVLSLLSKPSRREVGVTIDYVGFEIENKWVMGYGLDESDNKGRGRPEISEKI